MYEYPQEESASGTGPCSTDFRPSSLQFGLTLINTLLSEFYHDISAF